MRNPLKQFYLISVSYFLSFVFLNLCINTFFLDANNNFEFSYLIYFILPILFVFLCRCYFVYNAFQKFDYKAKTIKKKNLYIAAVLIIDILFTKIYSLIFLEEPIGIIFLFSANSVLIPLISLFYTVEEKNIINNSIKVRKILVLTNRFPFLKIINFLILNNICNFYILATVIFQLFCSFNEDFELINSKSSLVNIIFVFVSVIIRINFFIYTAHKCEIYIGSTGMVVLKALFILLSDVVMYLLTVKPYKYDIVSFCIVYNTFCLFIIYLVITYIYENIKKMQR